MCRLSYYLGEKTLLSNLVTSPDHSLIHQSYNAKEREEPLNGDGFGVAWYADEIEEAAVFKATTPAWNNTNLHDLARVTQSSCILAHVRAATQGLPVSESNCHPFRYKNFLFAHNGDIGDFKKLRRTGLRLLSDTAFNIIKGSTDSEFFFALLMDQLMAKDNQDLTDMVEATKEAIAKVEQLSAEHDTAMFNYLNFVLTNGKEAVVGRYTSSPTLDAHSLYFHQQIKAEDDQIKHPQNPKHPTVIVSSEPLSSDADWQPVPINKLMAIDEKKNIKLYNIC
jgi:glutamine amidotransferase